MAFDGITIAALVCELKSTIEGGKINKIAQPEPDELLLTIKNNRSTYRLLLSASASLPLLYLTDQNKPGPLTAPNFCMLLRKHIGSGRILSISQPEMERIVEFEIEHLNDLGDICRKRLIIELMGKHSNIIFCTPEGMILDSIKHVSATMSSVREVLPGREYFIARTQEKYNPLTIGEQDFYEKVCTQPLPTAKALYTKLTGLSPSAAEEICCRSSIDGGLATGALSKLEKIHLYHTFARFMEEVQNAQFSPNIVFEGQEPVEFASFSMTRFDGRYRREDFASMSEVLFTYYAVKEQVTRIRQKSSDLRRIVTTALERALKKYQLQLRQMKDTEKKEKYRIYGELLTTYGYSAKPGSKSIEVLNYYTNENLVIPLDPTISALENAKKYFDRYSKLKRTAEALDQQLAETRSNIEHLESISQALDIARREEDLVELKEELTEYGYIRRKYGDGKKVKITSRPFHYISSDGFHMYVGKNNYQNDELTFKFATGNDWWFHAKGQPGSHVIVKANGEELPDRTFEEAGQLAAFYSKGRLAPKVEIDYTQKKNIKKPSAAKPGFVIYHTNYSLLIAPDISNIQEVK